MKDHVLIFHFLEVPIISSVLEGTELAIVVQIVNSIDKFVANKSNRDKSTKEQHDSSFRSSFLFIIECENYAKEKGGA